MKIRSAGLVGASGARQVTKVRKGGHWGRNLLVLTLIIQVLKEYSAEEILPQRAWRSTGRGAVCA